MEKREEYIKFIKDQMKYYDEKSIAEKRRYYTLSIVALVANALVPIISTFSSIPSPYKQIVATLSAIAAICNGAAMIFNSSKNWKSYRNSFTDLETVLRSYGAYAGEFKEKSEEEAFDLFYEKCEAIINRDRQAWEPGTAKGGK